MSHSSAKFILRDGTTFHWEYNGTSDVMLTNMFETVDERSEMWRKQDWRECECAQTKLEPCIAHSHYGGEFWWFGKCCRQCMTFLGPFDPYEPPSGDDDGDFIHTDGEPPSHLEARWPVATKA